jgi:DNA anti-recombination protein RmuC
MYRTPSSTKSAESFNAAHIIELLQTLIKNVSSIHEEIETMQSNLNSIQHSVTELRQEIKEINKVENQTAGKIRFGNNFNNPSLLDEVDKTQNRNNGMNTLFYYVKAWRISH